MTRPLTVAQVAERLNCSVAHVGRLIGKKFLAATNISTGTKNAVWRVEEEDLAAYRERQKSKPVYMPSRSNVSRRRVRRAKPLIEYV